MKPANDNHADPITEMLGALRLGQSMGAQMDAITLRAMREDWSAERYGQEINKVLFGELEQGRA